MNVGVDRAKIAQSLYSAVLSDVMDGLGLMNQAMRPFVRPLDEALVLFGRARTGLYMPRYGVDPGEDPYETEIALIDDLMPGDVAVLACDGPTTRIAPWGELLSTASVARRAAGCVTDGLVRDIRRIREMRFPVFHGGIGPLDTKGRAKMMERDGPIACGGVKVASGDWIFGDADGVVVIPADAADEVMKRAFAKVTAEDDTRAQLAAGKTLREVFDKFGVL